MRAGRTAPSRRLSRLTLSARETLTALEPVLAEHARRQAGGGPSVVEVLVLFDSMTDAEFEQAALLVTPRPTRARYRALLLSGTVDRETFVLNLQACRALDGLPPMTPPLRLVAGGGHDG